MRHGLLIAVGLLGCGPVVSDGGGTEGGTADSDPSSTAPPTTATSTPPVSTTGVPPTSTTVPTATAPGTSGGTFGSDDTSDATTEALPASLQGIITRTRNGPNPVLAPCDFEEVCLVDVPLELQGCSGVYFEATGQLVAQGNGFIPTTCMEPFDFLVGEILEMRPCTADDCGGDPSCDPPSCDPVVDCPPFGYECEEDEMCRLRQGGAELPFWIFQCWPIEGTEAQLGDPCTVWTPETDGVDDCGQGLHCRANAEGSADGTCVALCGVADTECDSAECVACDHHEYIGLCVPVGETVNGSC